MKKRSQLRGKLTGQTAWIKRDKKSGEFMDVKKGTKKYKGVRREGLKKKSKKKRL